MTAAAAATDVEAMRQELSLRHAVVLRSFLDADDREWVRCRLAGAEFRRHTNEAVRKTELRMTPNAISAFLLFKVCDPTVLHLVDTLTGRGPAADFRGRTYRMVPGAGHVSPWHDDAVHDRIAALTINLSPEPFEGARLQVKDVARDEIVTEIDDLEFGDAALIQIDRAYQHRNSPLLGAVPKTSYAGFFYPGERSPLARA